MDSYYDAHCHLIFTNDAQKLAFEAQRAGIHALCSTVTPSNFIYAQTTFAENPNIVTGLGAHPWWIDSNKIDESDIGQFESLVHTAAFIGEVGLDFSGHRKRSKDKQIAIFKEIIQHCRNCAPGKPIFIHAVKSTEAVLDILENSNAFETNICIFHWFSGSNEQFKRALSRGALFSCSRRMISQGNGEIFTKAIPANRLLIETDNPAHEGIDWSINAWIEDIEGAMKDIAGVRECSVSELNCVIQNNYKKLLEAMNL